METNGLRTEDMETIHNAATIFFAKQLETEGSPQVTNELLNEILKLVTNYHNDLTISTPSKDEIRGALFSLVPLSAPGPNGLPAYFYQLYWDILEEGICNAVVVFFQGVEQTEYMKRNMICLIPKTTEPKRLKDFRPISLSNVICRLMSKIITLRMSSFTNEIISPE